MSIKDTILDIFFKATDWIPRKNAIIFESNPPFSDNTYWFFKYIAKNTKLDKKYKFIWQLKTDENFKNELCGKKIKCISKNPKGLKEKLDFTFYTHFSKYIFDCNNYVHKKNKKQIRVFLGHGMPVKIVKDYDLQKGDVDLNTITTYFFNKHFYEIGDTDSNMRNFGYCRTDVMFENRGKRKNREKTFIVWMPTYRQHSVVGDLRIENSFPLGLPVIKSSEQMADINNYLKEHNAILYIRPHPTQDISVMKLENLENIIIADNNYIDKKGLQLYEFLTETDALITDYSSVYYDYLAIDRPIALAVEDLEEFRNKWPMYFDDFKANYICPYLYTIEDLKNFIADVSEDRDVYSEERKIETHKFYDFTDGKTSERIYKYMAENYGL